MKEREDFIRLMRQAQLLNEKARLMMRRRLAEKLTGHHPFVISADGRIYPAYENSNSRRA